MSKFPSIRKSTSYPQSSRLAIPIANRWQRILTTLLKWGIVAGALTYIYIHLQKEGNSLPGYWHALNDWQMLWLIPVGLVSLANIGLEALRWRSLIGGVYPHVPMNMALQGIFAGISTGIFTPNKVGEYAGRMYHLPQGKRLEATILTFAGRLFQMLVTLWLGTFAVGALYFFRKEELQDLFPLFNNYYGIIQGALLLMSIAYTVMLMNPQWFYRQAWLQNLRIPGFKRMLSALPLLNRKVFVQVFSLSLARNLIHVAQYYFLMYALGYTGSIWLAFALVWTLYLAVSLLPSMALAELGIQESAALLIMGAFGIPAVIIFSSTFWIYMTSTLIPALIGLYFVFRLKFD